MIVIFTLMSILVLAVLPDSGQNQEAKDFGNKDELLWTVFLEATLTGT